MAKDVGNGFTLHVDWAGGTSWTAIAQILDITPPGITMEPLDVTTLDSTFTEYRPVEVEDNGELQFQLAFDWDLAGHQDFNTHVISGTDAAWKCTPPGNSGTNLFTFKGFVTSTAPGSITPKGLQTMTITVKLTSAITYTP